MASRRFAVWLAGSGVVCESRSNQACHSADARRPTSLTLEQLRGGLRERAVVELVRPDSPNNISDLARLNRTLNQDSVDPVHDRVGQAASAGGDDGTPGPVSYTHLTLPTNR